MTMFPIMTPLAASGVISSVVVSSSKVVLVSSMVLYEVLSSVLVGKVSVVSIVDNSSVVFPVTKIVSALS